MHGLSPDRNSSRSSLALRANKSRRGVICIRLWTELGFSRGRKSSARPGKRAVVTLLRACTMSISVLDTPHVSSTAATQEHEVAIVMPCLNEARTVGRCVAKAVAALARLGIDGEVIVADNGSTDGSQDIARAHGARVVNATRRGYGSALQAGIAAANCRYIIMGDADDSYDFSNIDPFIKKLREGDELVMGNRFKGAIRPGAMPWHHRYIGNPVLRGILNLFFRTPIRDAHCGLRAFRKDAFNKLKLDTPGMEFASEMVVKSRLQGQR